MISPREIERVVLQGELIEDYPEDPRGHSCLLLGFGDEGRPLFTRSVRPKMSTWP